MKYMKQGFALLMVLTIVLTIMPVRAENFSGEGQLAADGSLSGEGDKSSISGDTVSSPNGGEKELKKLTAEKKNAVEMAANGIDGAQSYAAGDIASGTDGNISWVIDGNGKLTVTGTGDSSDPWSEYKEEIKAAEINVTGMTDASGMFANCKNLTSLDLNNFDTSTVTNMVSMFSGCSSLVSIDVSHFDTSNVTDMGHMFKDCSNLQSLNLSNFNTDNVAGMNAMFEGCSQLSSVDVSSFNTSNVTDIGHMFKDCHSLKNLNIDNFNTSSAVNMGSMFRGCTSLENLDVSGFNVSNVENIAGMFAQCENLVDLNLSNFDTGSATVMTDMFLQCRNLLRLDISGFDTSNVTNMTAMFEGCNNLQNLDVSNFNTSSVTSMASMFNGCNNLQNLDVSNFNTSSVTDMSYMFYECYKLLDLDVSSFDTSNITDMMYTFGGCSSLNNLDVSGFDTSNVTNMSGMFSDCNSLKGLDVSGFNTFNVLSMDWMFKECHNISRLNVSNFNTSNVQDMQYMFENCSSLKSLDVSGFNTSNVMNMWHMFYGCKSLNDLDVSNFNTSNVSDMYGMGGMFSGCTNLISLDVSNFNTSNVVYMAGMFSDCSSLKNINVSNFDTSNVINMDAMFENCNSLSNLDISNFDMSNVEPANYMFSGCDNLITIYAPRNLTKSIKLPIIDDTDIWRLPDGTDITELPQNRSDSVILTRYRNPKIITETRDLNLSDVIRVKYVPYSYTVETNNWDPDNIVTYSIEKGTLARGLQMYPATGEIYGMPLEAGEFPITVKATFSNPRYLPSYKDLTLTVLDNTDSNVWNASDPGYEVEQYVGTLVSGSCPVLTELTDQLFVSTGAYREFIDFWLNGEKLVEGKDYTKEEGSTRITIRSQTFKEKADKSGVNTIAAEFRVGGDTNNALKRTAQNFRIKEMGNDNSGNPGSGSESGGNPESSSGRSTRHNGNIAPAPALQATAVVRLSTPSGTPLSGILLELHSTPMEAVTDANGAAIFNGVEGGWHTLYVKDANGTLLASKGFELLFGEQESMEGDRITAKAGEPFTLAVQMEGDKLTFIPVGETAVAQENQVPQAMQAYSANTGDSARPGLWLVLFVSFGALLAVFLYDEQKKWARKER